mmetsp:Transcript_26378/g.52981  ORF Transcript_26378/g.52981 Transcript_26378/m.52981 type:complete len:294 (-) Transcript_26378:58-939(-)
MWTMMSGQSSFDNNNNYHDNNNNNGPRRVYVHHINEDHINPMGYPPQQQYAPQPPPQPMFIPMPMSIPQPQPMPMPMFMGGMGGGMGYGFHQQPQPPVIIINGSGDQKPNNGGGDSSSSDDKESSSSSTSPFHPVSLVSVIFFVIASILGFICVAKIYDVFESSLNQNYENNEDKDLDEHILDYLVVHRTVALGMGAASILMFSIAFLLSFYAGMRYRLKIGKRKSKQKNCCLGGLLIAAWILFCLTFINGLIILVLAFDEEARIYPEVALTAVIGNMAAWICMFGYSQLARR